MNVLGLVFCILTVLSFGAVASLEKQSAAHRLRSGYLGHLSAGREILNQAASEYYKAIKLSSSSEKKERERKKEKQERKQKEPSDSPILEMNPSCARLNLFPLIDKGSAEEPFLYASAAKLLRVFYGKALFEKPRDEFKFLDAFLKEARLQLKNENVSTLEKIAFKEPHFQSIYYRMLKGTKQNDVFKEVGYPSLLDSIKIEQASSKICLCHTHPNLLSVFFTKGAAKLHSFIHDPQSPNITREAIEKICLDAHTILDPDVFDLFDLSRSRHAKNLKETLIGMDPATQVQLRKVVSLHRPS